MAGGPKAANKRRKILYKDDPEDQVQCCSRHAGMGALNPSGLPIPHAACPPCCLTHAAHPILPALCADQAAKLEEFLFGSSTAGIGAAHVFGNRGSDSDDQDLGELIHKARNCMLAEALSVSPILAIFMHFKRFVATITAKSIPYSHVPYMPGSPSSSCTLWYA